MRDRNRASGLVYALGALSAAAIVAAFLVVGPPSQSATLQSRVVTASEGVVQSTVSGSGNLQADSQLDLGFKTAGVVQRIYVSQGQRVTTGQLLAELDPQTAEVALEQAKATLQAAEATLAQEEESGGETSSSAGSGASARAASVDASVASFSTDASGSASAAGGATQPGATVPASTTPAPSTAPAAGTTPAASTTPAAVTTPAASTTPAATAPASTRKPSTGTHAGAGNGTHTATGATSTAASPAPAATSGSSEKPKQSAATKEANLASAKAAIRSDKLAVQSAEQAVVNTKLYAPQAGTIVSLTGEVGETVSGTGTSRSTTASSSSSSSTGSGSSAGGAAGGAGGKGASSSSSSSTGTGSSSSPFAVLSDLSGMQLVVPLSESEIVHVHEGQPATVTIEALEGMKLAAHVASVATLSSSNSGVVSYDVTFQLDQMTSGMRPGMSASAEVVVKQEEGVNVPTSAITAGSVTVQEGSRQVRRRVVTGLAGNSTTIILSGLKAGERVLVPVSSSSSATSLLSRLAGRGGGLGGRGATGGGGGGLFGG